MQAESQQPQKKSNMLHELIDGWICVLTEPGQETFLAQKSKVDSLKTVLGIGILGMIIGLWALVVDDTALIVNTNLPFIDLLQAIFITEAEFFIINLAFFFVAKGFGGEGSFSEQSYLLSLITAPLGAVIVAFLFLSHKLGLTLGAVLNPLNPIGIISALIILFAIYGLVLLLFAFQAAHEMKANAVLYTLGVVFGIWGILRVIAMFASHQDNIITQIWGFITQQWQGGLMQPLLLGHLWLVLFSVLVAVVIGVIIGVLITFPPRRPKTAHLVFAIPLIIFFLVWAVSSGVLGNATASQINSTVRTWDRSLRNVGGLFGGLLTIIGAILKEPAALGLIGMSLTVILYFLTLAGDKASDLTLYIASIMLTIPSIALFGVLIKPLGIGAFNAVFALVLYAQLPILRNTYTGIREVQPEIVEAGRGMGMTEFQLLKDVKLPLAVPVIMTGVRVSIVMLVGIAAIAAYIGNDTLGDYIFAGIQRAQDLRYITGALMVAILALVVDFLLGWLQNRLTPEGLKGR